MGMLSEPHYNHLDEAILMSTHNIHFHDKVNQIPKISQTICVLELSEEFPGDWKQVRISHDQPLAPDAWTMFFTDCLFVWDIK